jgi:mono/diheme cytochrome c family protein
VIALLPSTAMPGWSDAAHDPEALAELQPMRAKLDADFGLKISLGTALLPLITAGTSIPALSKENEGHYARWKTGTMDFFIQPLPYDDGVHTISKINALWGVPDAAELGAHSIPSAMLGWTGGTSSLPNFLHSFVELGGGDPAGWPADKLAPLADYIASLRAPVPAQSAPVSELERGRDAFETACLSCHGGPRGMGDHVFSYEEIGTDAAMKWWADGPDHDGQPAGGIVFPPGDTITHGIKSPRLVGLSHQRRYLHNGALDSLEQLLCLAPRAGVAEPAYGDGGHTFGCDLPEADRAALAAYLRLH